MQRGKREHGINNNSIDFSKRVQIKFTHKLEKCPRVVTDISSAIYSVPSRVPSVYSHDREGRLH
jgi:hypothetical protein